MFERFTLTRALNSGLLTSSLLMFSLASFTAATFPTRAKVVYQGKIRPIPAPRLDFIARYMGTVRQHPEWAAMYTDEALCREGEIDYWLPIQSSVLPYFRSEVAPGDTVEIFITWIGAHKTGDEVDGLFTIDEFEVKKEQGKPRVDAAACPGDDVLETLHDAAFFLEHRRDLARVARDIRQIRGQITSGSPGAAMVLPLLERIAALAARDGVLEPESEQIRSELHASPCLKVEAHTRFHSALPPLR